MVFDVEFLLSPETSSKNHSYCFQFPSDDFPIFVHLALSLFMTSLRSLRRVFFVVLLVTFLIFSRISCCCLDGRAISSFTWKRCFGFFPRTVSAVSFIAWAIFSTCYHSCLAGYVTSHLVLSCINQQRLCCLGYQGLLVRCISFWVGRAISFCKTSSRVYDRTVPSFLRMSEH